VRGRIDHPEASLDDLDQDGAFADLFRRQYPALHRYLRRRVGPALAEDLAAQTFAEAYRHRGRFDGTRPSAVPWLHGIAHNLLRQHRRQEVRQLRAYARSGVDPAVSDLADGAAARVDAAGQGPRLAAALAPLARRERDVLLLFAWAGRG
jgi:RNA polymerase sigma-70 factor (ECF subfamily)